ncbi:hypothetical protein TNCV_2573661 [Trichonephila clavipes]|nr:hypothetical protein TNCV_2573661 [Trichonephila clavipes]
MMPSSSFVNPTALAHADSTRDILPGGRRHHKVAAIRDISRSSLDPNDFTVLNCIVKGQASLSSPSLRLRGKWHVTYGVPVPERDKWAEQFCWNGDRVNLSAEGTVAPLSCDLIGRGRSLAEKWAWKWTYFDPKDFSPHPHRLCQRIVSIADASCTLIGPPFLKSRPPLQAQVSKTKNIRVPDRGLKAVGAA